jgi:hypothetical protein
MTLKSQFDPYRLHHSGLPSFHKHSSFRHPGERRGQTGGLPRIEMTISIQQDDRKLFDCTAVIIVPDIALSEAGHIRCMAQGQTGQSKHEFHALAQTAFYQYDDGDLDPVLCAEAIQIHPAGEEIVLESGLLIGRTLEGSLVVIGNSDCPLRKLLESANRFCTRWVRLDI